MHNDLTSMVIQRVKNIAGYPESSAEILLRPTLLENLDLYGDGDVRAMEVCLHVVVVVVGDGGVVLCCRDLEPVSTTGVDSNRRDTFRAHKAGRSIKQR